MSAITVQEYVDKHRLSQNIEESVNAAVRARAEDPILFISHYLKKLSLPVIKSVHARQILDSQGNPTIEVDIKTNRGTFRSSSPSGTATGIYEAMELRDNEKSFYFGKGVSKAIDNVNTIIGPALLGKDPRNQSELDRLMKDDLDGTENKERMGGNAILAVSMALCKAGAAESELSLYQYIADLAGSEKLSLPVPSFVLLNGGLQAGNRLPFQEIMVLPTGASSFQEALRMGTEIYHHLRTNLLEKFGEGSIKVGDDGGFAPPVTGLAQALGLVQTAIERAGCSGLAKIAVAAAGGQLLSASASTTADSYLYDAEIVDPERKGSTERTGSQMVEFYGQLCSEFGIVSIEDPFHQNDFESTKALTALNACQVVGSELLVTNPKRISIAIENKTCDALLLKIGQAGTVSEALEAVRLARSASWAVITGARAGETDDSFLADFSVAVGAGQLKAGAPCRGERLAKYNQLLRIEEELGEKAVYAGQAWQAK